MAISYIENLVSKIGLDNIFQRKNAQPLDRSSIFASYDDALKYAAYAGLSKDEQKLLDKDSRKLGPTAYIGQIITVYEDDKVDVYKINADRTLGEVGGVKADDFNELCEKVEDDSKVTAYALIDLKKQIENNVGSGDGGSIIEGGIIDCGTF